MLPRVKAAVRDQYAEGLITGITAVTVDQSDNLSVCFMLCIGIVHGIEQKCFVQRCSEQLGKTCVQ